MARKKNKLLKLGLRVFVTVGVLGALAYFLPVKTLLDSIRAISWKEWLIVIFFFIVCHVISALKWRKMLHAAGVPVKVKDAIIAHAAGLFANLCLPSIVGGDVLRAGIVVKKSGKLEAVSLGSITDRIIDTVALITITAIASLFLPDLAGKTMNQVF
ncbi:MAG: flippase-like domain-containing protein, partial [Methyloprofundus sp.]|nr:flippase-like domain-containing protein [Methyloprofundus sp.]